MYHKCDIQCKTCKKYSSSSDPKCTSCNNDLNYYLAIDKPSSRRYNKTTIGNEYVLMDIDHNITGESIKQWTKSYKTCRTCYNFKNEFDHNCSSCIKMIIIYWEQIIALKKNL